VSPRHGEGQDGTREMRSVATGATPAVSTAPPAGLRRRWWSSVPHHLGRARTSTAVLVVLFLAIGTLYLYVRPETTASGIPVDPANQTSVPVTEAPTPAEPTRTTTPTETSEPTETEAPTDTGTQTQTTTPTATSSRTRSAPATTQEETPGQRRAPTATEEPTSVPQEPEPSESPLTRAPEPTADTPGP
jgi:hypothetical protein